MIGGSLNADRLLAAGFIAAFLILTFVFALLATRALEGQLARFLDAPRRLGSGDLSAPIQTSERNEFAALSEEFDRPRQSTGEDLEGPWCRDGAGAPPRYSVACTASVGVAASSDRDKDDRIVAAANALQVAKHEGKNRTAKAEPQTANVCDGE